MSRTTATSSLRPAIRPHTNSLAYTASTATTLGTGTTLDSTGAWAVEWWMDISRGKSLTAANGIWVFETDQATPFVFFYLGFGTGRGFEWGSSANFDRFFCNISTDPNLWTKFNTGWHHWVLTFDGVDRTLDTSYKLYIDGVSRGVTNGSGLGSSTDQNAIGAAVSGGVAGTFDMSTLRVWNGGTAMTAAQVADLYSSNILPSGPTLTRNYLHGDGSGTTLTDSTGNQNGTIGTAAWSATNLPTNTRTAATARTAV